MKCTKCRKTIRVNQKRIGMMHAKCHAEFTKLPKRWSHQEKTLRLLRRSPMVFDASDAGTGKTRPAIEAWAERRRKGGGKALVLAVKSSLEVVWRDEASKWAPDFLCVTAYASNRDSAFAADADIYITNTDATKWLAKQKPAFFRDFDTLIVDESSYYKHRTSQRSKALASIRRHFQHIELMSGTPNSNTILDIWHQAFVLDGGQRLGTSFFRFRSIVCTPVQVGPKREHVRWDDKPHATAAVFDLLKDVSIRHEFDDCMDIPPNRVRRIHYPLPPKLRAQYEKLKDDAILTLEKENITGVNKAALRSKLLQVCSGAAYTHDSEYSLLDTGRYALLADLIEERDHSITFFVWRHQRDELIKELEHRKLSFAILDGTVAQKDRTRVVKAYQAGEYRTLLMHPKTGAHALTLTRGTAVIWASPIYEADLLKQGIHRIRRGSQTKRTETVLVEASGTVEGIVYGQLDAKTGRMMDLLDMLKEAD